METIDSLRQTLEACQERFDNKISPALEAADQAVQEYGFGSYMDLMATMMRLSKTIVVTSKKIKELSTIEEEIEEMDDLLEVYEPIVNEMLPTVQNVLVETLPSDTFDDMNDDKGLEGLVKFITT
jgi:wobble nucleotide-excising tRNase